MQLRMRRPEIEGLSLSPRQPTASISPFSPPAWAALAIGRPAYGYTRTGLSPTGRRQLAWRAVSSNMEFPGETRSL